VLRSQVSLHDYLSALRVPGLDPPQRCSQLNDGSPAPQRCRTTNVGRDRRSYCSDLGQALRRLFETSSQRLWRNLPAQFDFRHHSRDALAILGRPPASCVEPGLMGMGAGIGFVDVAGPPCLRLVVLNPIALRATQLPGNSRPVAIGGERILQDLPVAIVTSTGDPDKKVRQEALDGLPHTLCGRRERMCSLCDLRHAPDGIPSGASLPWLRGEDSNLQPTGYVCPCVSPGNGLSHHPRGVRGARGWLIGPAPHHLVSAPSRLPLADLPGLAQGYHHPQC